MMTFKDEIINVITGIPFLTSYEQIDKLEKINGVLICDIENDAKPNRYSASGFLGSDEKLQQVLKTDWKTVESFNTTHQILATHLANIISIAIDTPIIEPFKPVTVTYAPTKNPIPFNVSLMSTRGWQYDLFQPPQGKQREMKTPDKWCDDNLITNLNNNTSAKLTLGSLSYIYQMGFYEGGGNNNSYRNDPNNLIKLLEL